MNPSSKCLSCGAAPPDGALTGLCPACLVALASEPLGDSIEPESAPLPTLGDYELLEEIATGGMGVVFRARQRSLNRLVALKMIRARQLAGSAEVQRFRREAEAAANLDHPNIVPIYEVGESEGQHYFSMKLIEGPSLAEQIERGQWKLTGENCRSLQFTLAALLAKVARAVHHAHERAVLHRDLKPSNILVDDQGEPHLTDFGLAKLIERGHDLTRSFAVMGTVGYMSPEQAAGKSRQITTSADIYSLGVILFELLTGRQPFPGDDAISIMRAITDSDPARPRSLNPHIDADLETICLKCLEKAAGRRYSSALELARDLERWQRHEPILARSGTPWERTVKWVQRRPLRAALYAVSAAATGIILWLSTYASRQQQDAARAHGKVTDTVSQMDVQRSQDFFETENPAMALAHLARILRDNPDNTAAATRLMAALTQRPFALPLWELKTNPPFRAVNFSPDGLTIVTTAGNSAHIRDIRTGSLLVTLGPHGDAVLDAQFSPDGNRIVTASKDRMARLWEARTGRLLGELAHVWWVRSAGFSPDGQRVLTVASNTVVLWEPGRRFHQAQQVSGSHARCAHFSPAGEHIVAGSQDGTAVIWKATDGKLVSKFTAHEKAIRSARFSPDGGRVVTASDDGTARVWEARSGRPLTPPLPHEGPVVAADFHPEGNWLVTGSADGTARLWDAQKGSAASEPFRHGGPVNEAAFSPNGDLLLTASDDGKVRLWDVPTGRPMAEPVKHGDFLERARFSPDGRQFFTLTADGAVQLWRLPATQALAQPLLQGDEAARYDWCSAGSTAVVLSNDWVSVCDLQTGQLLAPPRRQPGIQSARVSAGGQYVAAIGPDHSVELWKRDNPATQKLPSRQPVEQIEFSGDGRRLLTVAATILRVWDAESAASLGGPWQAESPIAEARFNNDGQKVVSVSGKRASVWEVRAGASKPACFDHPADVVWAEFAPDGRRLLTISQDRTVRIWGAFGSKAAELKHGAAVHAAHFSPDGQAVATASLGTARIWNVRDGKLLSSMDHAREVNSAQFSPDGQRLVTAAANQTIRVWDVATGLPLTDPIESSVPVWDARYTVCGRWVLARSGSGPVGWEMPQARSPVPEWLPSLGEAVAGVRLSAARLPEPVESDALAKLREELITKRETNSYAHWARWFVAEPSARTISPSASTRGATAE
jgi:WD40 repeat protein/tRNA A-37 threonylcarbamoyl transferase component Bud32